jgi:Flp pilus assembly protein TadB
MRKWLIVALFLAWLSWELIAAFDGSKATWPLTQIIVTYLPAWIYLPAALLLAVWLPWHLWSNRKRRQQRVTSSLIRTDASRQRKEMRPQDGPHRNNA